MNLSLAPVLPTVPQTGDWYRAIPPKYYPASALGVAHTVQYASRFYAGPATATAYQILYLARSPEIALREIEVLYGPSASPLSNLRAVTLFSVEVRLQQLVDLTEPGVQAALQTTAQELTGDWKVYSASAPPAPTQQLGASLFTAGVEGVLTPSAKVPDAVSLVIFPQNLLRPVSFVRHTDPITGMTYSL